MSNDDIVFGDVNYRQPQRMRRPDRDRHFANLAYEVPGPDDLPIFLDRLTADAIERHALSDTSVELGGILLGQECIDDQTSRPFVWVTQSLEAKHYENTQSSFTYTHQSWEEITRERDLSYPNLDIVGWYHTHPDFGIFLSSHDQFIHRHFFEQPLQVAYVVDPIRQTRGFFQWRADALDQVGGFYLTADRGDRIALARLVNDLENIPNAMGGGGLSPRLEAELIDMLARPSYPATVADRGQTAAVFTVMGVTIGVLGLALVLWLNTLGSQMQEQNKALKALASAIEKSDSEHKIDLDAVQIKSKEDALNTLLREAKAGSAPDRFASLYADLSRDRDEARLELKKQKVNYSAVFDLNQRLQSDLSVSNQKVASLEEKAKKVPPLEDEVAELKGLLKERDTRMADKAIFRKYDYAWYAAVGGWVISIFLGLGLVTVWGRAEPALEPGEEAPH